MHGLRRSTWPSSALIDGTRKDEVTGVAYHLLVGSDTCGRDFVLAEQQFLDFENKPRAGVYMAAIRSITWLMVGTSAPKTPAPVRAARAWTR